MEWPGPTERAHRVVHGRCGSRRCRKKTRAAPHRPHLGPSAGAEGNHINALIDLLRCQREIFQTLPRWVRSTKPLPPPSRTLPPAPLGGSAQQGDLLVCRVEEDPGAALLHVSGEVDLFTAPLLRDHLVRLVDERRGGIVVVLAEVQYMDMAGIRALEHGLRRAQERGSRLVLASPSPIVRRVFEIVGMQNQLPVLPTKTAALLHLAGGASG